MIVAGSLHRLLKTSTLCLTVGVTLLLCSQAKMYAQEQRDEAKPQQEQEARPEANKDDTKQSDEKDKAARQDQAKPAEQSEDKPAKEEKPSRSDDRPAQQQENDKSAQQMNRGGQAGDHAQGSGRAARIPDDKFKASFGRQHTFKVQRPTVVEGRPQFQYGGFTFFIQDAWPAGWAYTDDCYIDFIHGEYFLFDLAHPGVRIAIVVIS